MLKSIFSQRHSNCVIFINCKDCHLSSWCILNLFRKKKINTRLNIDSGEPKYKKQLRNRQNIDREMSLI